MAPERERGGGEGRRAALDLEAYVPALITFLANKLTHGASVLYRRRFGVGVIEWRCLSQLAIEPWIPPGRITEVIGLDKAAVSRAIHALERQGLVKIRSSAERSRFLEVALTDKGHALHDRILKLALEREQILLADLSAEERAVLLRALNKMHDRLPRVNAPTDDGGA